MKKVLKVIGIIVLVIVLAVAALLIYLSTRPSVPTRYTKTVKTGGAIEATYLAQGSHQVKSYTVAADEPIVKYHVYYPADMADGATYPVILSANGTGITADKYPAWFKHMASWGFIVVGNEDPSSGTGESTDIMFDWVLAQASTADSPLAGHVDSARIGVVGHSQGGAGVLCAVSVCLHAADFAAAVALSPTQVELAHAFGWTYDMASVQCPLLMFAGTEGEFETVSVIPPEVLASMYAQVPGECGMARRIGAEHGAMLYSADGYVTAWFMWKMQGDEEAAAAFAGASPELAANGLYQDAVLDVR